MPGALLQIRPMFVSSTLLTLWLNGYRANYSSTYIYISTLFLPLLPTLELSCLLMDRIIEFDRVAYQAGGNRVLQDLSFFIKSGELLVLLGRSGSGKTTTLKLVNALLVPTAGRVLVEGKPTSEWDPIRLRRKSGYVIQEVGLFPHFTVERNVGLVPSLESWPEEKIRTRIHE